MSSVVPGRQDHKERTLQRLLPPRRPRPDVPLPCEPRPAAAQGAAVRWAAEGAGPLPAVPVAALALAVRVRKPTLPSTRSRTCIGSATSRSNVDGASQPLNHRPLAMRLGLAASTLSRCGRCVQGEGALHLRAGQDTAVDAADERVHRLPQQPGLSGVPHRLHAQVTPAINGPRLPRLRARAEQTQLAAEEPLPSSSAVMASW